MEKIKAIKQEIKTIRAKLDIGASDWTKDEKEAIAKAYFEITKESTTKGRVLDTGCTSCVASATNIIKNYLTAIDEPVKEETAITAKTSEPATVGTKDSDKDADLIFSPKDKEWRKNLDSISAAAKELEFTFDEKDVTKAQRITALEAHMKELNK